MKVAAAPRSMAQVAAVLAFVISHTTFLAAQDDETGRCPKIEMEECFHKETTLGAAYFCFQTRASHRSARKIEGFARNDDGAKRYQNFAALLIFMRRTTTLNPPT